MSESMQAAGPPKRLLEQVRDRQRYLHDSLRTEQAYVYWIRQFVLWRGRRHPRDRGQAESEGVLTALAQQRQVSPTARLGQAGQQ